jgi:hypothetical protein
MLDAPLPRPDAWLIAVAIVMTSGCARVNPGETVGDSVLRHQLERQGNGLIRLVSFTKTGGQRSSYLGVTTYTMAYGAQIEFLKDACYGGGISALDYVPPRYDRSGRPASDALPAACFRNHVSRGERREVTGSLPFEQVAKGRWRGPDGQTY